MHLWKVVGALHKPNGIHRKANVPYGKVNVVFSWSSGDDGNLIIAIEEAVILMASEPVEHLVDEGESEVILPSGSIQLPIVPAHSKTVDSTHWNEFIFHSMSPLCLFSSRHTVPG